MISFNITGNGQQNQIAYSGNFSHLLLSYSATSIADINASVLEATQIVIKVNRGGQTFTIVSGNAFALGLGNNVGSFEGQTIGTYRSLAIDFTSSVLLNAGDTLSVTVQTSGAAAGQQLQVTTYWDGSISADLPNIFVNTVDPTLSNQNMQAGDNVRGISVVSTNANLVDFTSISITGSAAGRSYNNSLTTPDFYALAAQQHDSLPVYFAFQILNGLEVDQVLIKTNNANNAGNTYVVVYATQIDPTTAVIAEKATTAVLNKEAQKFS